MHQEPFQVIHYDVGQEYTDHADGYDATTDHGKRYTAATKDLSEITAGSSQRSVRYLQQAAAKDLSAHAWIYTTTSSAHNRPTQPQTPVGISCCY